MRSEGLISLNFTRTAGSIGSEAFLDGSFVSAHKGLCVGKTKRGKGTSWMVVVDGQGVPLGGPLASTSPAEVNLAQITLDAISVPRHGRGRPRERPMRLIVDKGYDADWFHKILERRGIKVVCPHRRGRASRSLQKEYEFGRYTRR